MAGPIVAFLLLLAPLAAAQELLQPHAYDAPLGGGCRGPRGEEHVSGKSRDHIATQAECQSSCDAEAACLGYRYYGNIADCYLYGAGMRIGVWWTLEADGPPRPSVQALCAAWTASTNEACRERPITSWTGYIYAPPYGTDTIARGVAGGA